ncbi:MAG: 4Fe-4S dicluster domain-containing protein, partial [Candidatus Eisenbacteria bacterium]
MNAPETAPQPGTSAPATGGVSWYDADDTPDRRELETCIHCGLCLTACPTYRTLRIEPDSPRGRLYLMRGLAEGRIEPSADLVHHLDQCLDCRACETVCPAGVPYGRLLEQTRGQLARRVPEARKLGPIGEWVLRQVMPDRGRMHLVGDLLRLSQSAPIAALMGRAEVRSWLPPLAAKGYAMTPAVPPRDERALERVAARLPAGARLERREDAMVFHPPGAPRLHVGFFTSCVMEVLFSRINQELVRLLVLAGCRVTVPEAQTCCGALHAHAGLRHEARALARRNVGAFDASLDAVVTDSAGCGAALRECGHLLEQDPVADQSTRFGAKVRDVSEVLDQVGL